MNEYRPNLEKLAFELYQTRIDRNRLNKNAEDIAKEVKEIMHSAGLTYYKGQSFDIALPIVAGYKVNPEVALNYFELETLLEIGVIEINRKKFEDHLKEAGISLDEDIYLTATGSHERVEVNPKK